MERCYCPQWHGWRVAESGKNDTCICFFSFLGVFHGTMRGFSESQFAMAFSLYFFVGRVCFFFPSLFSISTRDKLWCFVQYVFSCLFLVVAVHGSHHPKGPPCPCLYFLNPCPQLYSSDCTLSAAKSVSESTSAFSTP